MKKVLLWVKDKWNKLYSNEYFKAFLWIYLIGLFCFATRAAFNYFTLPMGGDYVLQTYAFYSQGYHMFWEFIKTGQMPLYDFSNFLGANYLGTQSFYYVFSPLFYLLCLWPEKLLYQGIFFHMVFKFALGGFFMFILLRKYFKVSYKMSWLGGFIYAFSGWALFYLWFHFGDAMAFFPLFIIGIEKCLKERKGWLLSLSLCLCALANYFFIVNFCIFGALYALYRWIHIYGINKKRGYSASVRWGVLLQGILHCAVGLLMAAMCLLPSLQVALSSSRSQTSANYLMSILQAIYVNPSKVDGYLVLGEAKTLAEFFKADNLKHLFNTLFVWQDRYVSSSTSVASKTHIGYLLSSWLYMNTNCWDNVMFNNTSLDNAIGGFFITTPLTMLLIPSIVNAFKSKRPWTIFGVILCLTLPFFPITAHAAFGFTSLYGRWQLWLVLIGILFIIPTLDKFDKVNRRWVSVNLLFNFTLAVIIYFISKADGKLPNDYIINILGMKVPGMILVSVIELIVMLVVWFIYRFKFFKVKLIKQIMTVIVVIEIGTSCIITVENKSYSEWENYYLSQPQYEELSQVIKDLKEEDPSFYRIFNTEATRSTMNMPSALNYNGASTFNSTYNFNLDDFIYRSRMAYSGSWTMGNHEKRFWFDQYIGSKYYIIDKLDVNNDNAIYKMDEKQISIDNFFNGRTSTDEENQQYRINIPIGYELYKEYDYFYVYVNKNYSGIGYSVDEIINTTSAGKGKVPTHYEELYASTAIVDTETIDKIVAEVEDVKVIDSYIPTYKNTLFSGTWDLYFSPRNDYSYWKEGNYDRHTYKLTNSNFTKSEISSILDSKSQFMHKRWEEKERFGDQFILKLQNEDEYIVPLASKQNMAYVTVSFKLGPKVLISLYNDDKLVTQDAHMNSNSSLNATSYEWKSQRGFYVDQPFNKIVIEFVADTPFNKVFNTSGSLPNIDITYSYQSDIAKMQERIKENALTDVTYKNNKFTFNSSTSTKKLFVTNIPYDDGWTLLANGNKKEILKVNGGFIGFISEEGDVSYSLSYFTPLLKEGLIGTLIGILLLVALCYIYKNKKVDIHLIETTLSMKK